MKRLISLILALTLLLGVIPTAGVEAAEAKAIEPVVQDFENAQMHMPVAELDGFADVHGASVVKVPGEDNQAVWLHDAAEAATPYLNYSFDESVRYSLEFDVYADENSSVNIQFYDGILGNGNGAYILLFDKEAGLKGLHGKPGASSWDVVASDVFLTPNTWNNVYIEINPNGRQMAMVYLNGELVYETSSTYPKADPLYGLYMSTGGKTESCYLDGLKLDIAACNTVVQPAPFASENFEALAVGAVPSAATLPGYVSHKSAMVRSDPANSGEKALRVYDASNAVNADFEYGFDSSNRFVLDFELYPTDARSISLQVRKSSGYANMAFWLQFRNTGLWSYDGPSPAKGYQRLSTVTLKTNQWNSIHIEFTTGANAQAAVYINDQYAGTAAKPAGLGSAAATVSRVYIQAADKAGCFYLDDLTVSSVSYTVDVPAAQVNEDFDSVTLMYGAPDSVEGYMGHKEASVQPDPLGKNGKSLKLDDPDDTTIPEFQYSYAASSKMTMEFDVCIPNSNTSVSFYFFNGTKSFGKATSCLSFNPTNGLVAYNGSAWTGMVDANAKLTPNKWEKVRVDISTGAKQEATVYLNGTKLGTTQVVCSQQATVNGFHIYLGSGSQSAYLDNLKVTPAVNITWRVGNVETLEACYAGTVPQYNGQLTEAADDDFHYVFSGWDKPIVVATSNETYTAVFEAVSHTMGQWQQIIAPDWYNEGFQERSCEICGYTQTQTIPKLSIDGIVYTEELMYLEKDVTADSVTVDAGMTLDLNGHSLCVENLICFGTVVDTSDANSGKLVTQDLVLENMTDMPVYDTEEGCYRFYSYALKNLGIRKTQKGSVTYGFGIGFENSQAYEVIAKGNSGVKVNALLSWEGSTGMAFAFSEELVQEYAHLQSKYHKAQVVMMLNITGLETLELGTELAATLCASVADHEAWGEPQFYVNEDGFVAEEKPLLELGMGALFDIADNTETEGLPANDPYVKEDFSASGGVYGFTQIPNALYDPDTDRVYVNYNRHRDVVVDYPYDSTRVYNVETLLNAGAGAQLQDSYVQMKTENTMFLTGMAKLSDGKLFCLNYMTYYLTDTSATTYSWIIDGSGKWTRVTGVLTIPKELAASGAQPNSKWHRYAFSRCLIELDDGTLLASMYGTYGTILVQSKDRGKTWTYRSTIAESAYGLDQPYKNTDGTDITWFEPAVTRCADGTLLCVMRTWRDKPLYQTRSYDNGLSWTEPTLLPGLDIEKQEGMSIYPQLLLLSNGVLALATGVPGDTVYFSADGCGYNWDDGIVTYSGSTTGNAAIAEVDYDEATGTVTLLAFGDKGFNNKGLSGVWGRTVTVKRNHVKVEKLASAIIRAETQALGLGESTQLRVDAVLTNDADVVADGYSVQWNCLTPELAAVDQTGKVTAKAAGTAKVQIAVTWNGKTVLSNVLQLELRDRAMPVSIDGTGVNRWVMQVGEMASVNIVAQNYFGQHIVTEITQQEYINDDPNVPKYLLGDVDYRLESLTPELLSTPAKGTYRAVAPGVAELLVTVVGDGVTFTKTITIIIESNQWVTEGFESGAFPANVTVSKCVSISTSRRYSGSRSAYINDNSTSLAPYLRLKMPESKGMIVEFMIYVENNEHSPTFGVGHPMANGGYNYTCNAARVGLLYNALTGAQGYQAWDGNAWSRNNRNNVIPVGQWNKIRLEITTDKAFRLYANGKLLAELPLANTQETLNILEFTSGGSAYTGDAFYVDDIRYMILE